jgi:hypothetical protein
MAKVVGGWQGGGGGDGLKACDSPWRDQGGMMQGGVERPGEEGGHVQRGGRGCGACGRGNAFTPMGQGGHNSRDVAPFYATLAVTYGEYYSENGSWLAMIVHIARP